MLSRELVLFCYALRIKRSNRVSSSLLNWLKAHFFFTAKRDQYIASWQTNEGMLSFPRWNSYYLLFAINIIKTDKRGNSLNSVIQKSLNTRGMNAELPNSIVLTTKCLLFNVCCEIHENLQKGSRPYYFCQDKVGNFVKISYTTKLAQHGWFFSSLWYSSTHLALSLAPCGVPMGWTEFYSQSSLLYVTPCLYQQHWRTPPTERQ